MVAIITIVFSLSLAITKIHMQSHDVIADSIVGLLCKVQLYILVEEEVFLGYDGHSMIV